VATGQTLYAESSAVLRWLLGAEDSEVIRSCLIAAETVVTSALTAAEVGRTLERLCATDSLDRVQRDRAWASFSAAAAHWQIYAVTQPILERAREPFAIEPLRTLDAIHLCTALEYGRQLRPVAMLTTDARLRDNAKACGIAVALLP